MAIAAHRHLKAAKDLANFTDKQIDEAVYEIQQRPEIEKIYTLETIIKYITK